MVALRRGQMVDRHIGRVDGLVLLDRQAGPDVFGDLLEVPAIRDRGNLSRDLIVDLIDVQQIEVPILHVVNLIKRQPADLSCRQVIQPNGFDVESLNL